MNTLQLDKVVALRQRDDSEGPGHVRLPPRVHLGDQRVANVGGAEDPAGLVREVPCIELLDPHDRHDVVVRGAEHQLHAFLEPSRIRDGQRDGNREQHSSAQPHLLDDAKVVRASHEPVERRERARGQQLEVAQRPRRKLDRGQARRTGAGLAVLIVAGREIDEPASIGIDEPRRLS